MIFGNHKFMHNFLSADGAGEDEIKRDIIITEVERLIADRPQDVLDVMLSSDINIRLDADTQDLVETFVINADTNKSFQKNLAELIIDNNKSQDKQLNSNGGTFGGGFKSPTLGSGSGSGSSSGGGGLFDKAKDLLSGGGSGSGGAGSVLSGGASGGVSGGADPVSAIAGAIGSIFSFASTVKENKNLKEQTKNSILTNLNIQQQRQLLAQQQAGAMSPLMKGTLIIGVIAIVGTIALIVIKSRRNK